MGICMEQYVITISRQFGSMGRSIAKSGNRIPGQRYRGSHSEAHGTSGIRHQRRGREYEVHIFPQAVSARDGNVQPER